MKRPAPASDSNSNRDQEEEGEEEESSSSKKKSRVEKEEEGRESSCACACADLGEDLVLEVLKRADARTAARAACVSRRWRRMAEDERLWEAVCTRQWATLGCGAHKLRSVVLALGGFRRLHSAYLLPLLQPSSHPRRGLFPSLSSSSSSSSSRWGKDEVQLSLSLLSIGYFMTNCSNTNNNNNK